MGLEGGGVAAEEHDVDAEEDGDGDAKGKAAEAEEEHVQHGTCVVLCGVQMGEFVEFVDEKRGNSAVQQQTGEMSPERSAGTRGATWKMTSTQSTWVHARNARKNL